MAEYTSFKGLNATNNRIEMLMADFSGLENLENAVSSVLQKLSLQENVQRQVALVRSGSLGMQEFDGWFSDFVRVELGRVLGILRNKAIAKASSAGAGSASSAVTRRMYKDEFGGNINIASHKRMSSRRRIVPEPTGGESGIRRPRTVKNRTRQLREYYGPDRDFILRILENGRDVYYAKSDGPTGRRSMATYGRRGAITARNWFFHSMKSDMEQAAQQLGQTLTGAVEKWVEQKFTESKEQ